MVTLRVERDISELWGIMIKRFGLYKSIHLSKLTNVHLELVLFITYKCYIKRKKTGQVWWCTPVIAATQEAEMSWISVSEQYGLVRHYLNQ
jgi:hypothetical protein